MAQKRVNDDFIREPYRGELSKRLNNPREGCSQYKRCSANGTKLPVLCELKLKAQREFDPSLSKLLNLSDVPGWHSLRGAIRELDRADALKTCVLIGAFWAVILKLRNEEQLIKAKGYEPAWEYGADRVKRARLAIQELELKIKEAEVRRPEELAVKNFTKYKHALCALVACGLTALEQLYEIEGRATSPKTLGAVYKTQFRGAVDEILHESSRTDGARYWGQLQDLLDGVEEVVRRPHRSDWKKEPPVSFDANGNRLRKDVEKITDTDRATVKMYFDSISPGLFEQMENASDQVAVLVQVMNSQHPPFPPILSYTLQLALAHRDDLESLRAKQIDDDQ